MRGGAYIISIGSLSFGWIGKKGIFSSVIFHKWLYGHLKKGNLFKIKHIESGSGNRSKYLDLQRLHQWISDEFPF